MKTKMEIITIIQLALWVLILGLCGGIEFLDGWDILLNMLMMALTGTIIILLSKLKEVMINEYKRKRINTIREISKV
ncbi:MAG: hypothetical protein E7J07_04140 [Veillonella sp.]|uniref:hypothetical protein n=1 Tax=Veillonella TaxID=29465 RepID=UPI002671D8B5|nr:hypothetical protein [Veillonella sp.]MDU4513556.1 hypothetical protein [Veillonella sp.]